MSMTLSRPEAELNVSTGRVIRQLGLFEGRRQLRSPFLWLAALASFALALLAVQDEPATLWARSVTIAGSCLPIAVAVLLLGNAAALRDHSSRIGETAETPPTLRDARILGLVAGSWAGLLLSVAVVVIGAVLSNADDPAGSFLLQELTVGPLLVPLGQALGVTLGRWIPNPLAAPLTLVVVAGLFLIQDFWPGERTIPAASPFLPWRQAYTDWVQGEPRLPLHHLAYVIGLIGVLTAVASRRWAALAVAALVVAGTAVGLSGVETAGEQVSAAVEAWADEQPRVCQELDGVQYCAIEGYEPWIDDWAAVVHRVSELVPGELGVNEIQQAPGWHHLDTDPAIAHVHGRLPVDGDLTQQILAPELGMPGTGGEAAEVNSELSACMASLLPVFVSGEARAVAYLAFTELAVPASIRTGGFGGSYQFGQIEMSEDEADLALQISGRPKDEVLATLHPRWEALASPATSSAALAEWFGLEPPALAETSSYEAMQCECTGDGVSCSSRGMP